MQEQSIPCPVCQTKIPFEVKSLLMGVSFTCPSCFANIGISPESLPVAKDAVQKFNDLKQTIASNKKQ